ncbi:hypothetical protein DACRYDRAFT_105148 [Dacryopinax primogenitus]|uniref:Uncharacterized protein n=1 Tax=Dacryopinax primogenitus (strain DJM 731) TaxID=1858805 RepID=M5GCV6_DACPD|nr:uncharacterized protein DACRYDRAFT_105148 [Dacryopinax primogenitus]EJU04082.1 hypothetical protein DACRYDRAFT_105148 [Dacryopinax primogenitus]
MPLFLPPGTSASYQYTPPPLSKPPSSHSYTAPPFSPSPLRYTSLPSPSSSPILQPPSACRTDQPSYPSRRRKRPWKDPYASPWARAWLRLEVDWGLSMMQPWEKGLSVGVIILVLCLLGLAMYELPASVVFVVGRLRYFAAGY